MIQTEFTIKDIKKELKITTLRPDFGDGTRGNRGQNNQGTLFERNMEEALNDWIENPDDLRLLENVGCDVVFTPSVDEMYSKNSSTLQFDFDGLEDIMEGAFRSGHFNGVGTVVKLLFEMINPTRAYFGEKDFQQLLIIRKMVEKHQLPVQIIGCSIFREDNGLAMSSRNERLSKSAKQEAALIYRILTVVREMTTNHSLEDIHQWVCLQFKDHPLFFLEYFIIANERTLQTATIIDPKIYYRAFIAVKVGSVRLIDNIAL